MILKLLFFLVFFLSMVHAQIPASLPSLVFCLEGEEVGKVDMAEANGLYWDLFFDVRLTTGIERKETPWGRQLVCNLKRYSFVDSQKASLDIVSPKGAGWMDFYLALAQKRPAYITFAYKSLRFRMKISEPPQEATIVGVSQIILRSGGSELAKYDSFQSISEEVFNMLAYPGFLENSMPLVKEKSELVYNLLPYRFCGPEAESISIRSSVQEMLAAYIAISQGKTGEWNLAWQEKSRPSVEFSIMTKELPQGVPLCVVSQIQIQHKGEVITQGNAFGSLSPDIWNLVLDHACSMDTKPGVREGILCYELIPYRFQSWEDTREYEIFPASDWLTTYLLARKASYLEGNPPLVYLLHPEHKQKTELKKFYRPYRLTRLPSPKAYKLDDVPIACVKGGDIENSSIEFCMYDISEQKKIPLVCREKHMWLAKESYRKILTGKEIYVGIYQEHSFLLPLLTPVTTARETAYSEALQLELPNVEEMQNLPVCIQGEKPEKLSVMQQIPLNFGYPLVKTVEISLDDMKFFPSDVRFIQKIKYTSKGKAITLEAPYSLLDKEGNFLKQTGCPQSFVLWWKNLHLRKPGTANLLVLLDASYNSITSSLRMSEWEKIMESCNRLAWNQNPIFAYIRNGAIVETSLDNIREISYLGSGSCLFGHSSEDFQQDQEMIQFRNVLAPFSIDTVILVTSFHNPGGFKKSQKIEIQDKKGTISIQIYTVQDFISWVSEK